MLRDTAADKFSRDRPGRSHRQLISRASIQIGNRPAHSKFLTCHLPYSSGEHHLAILNWPVDSSDTCKGAVRMGGMLRDGDHHRR
jgi:hypothetical protein